MEFDQIWRCRYHYN